MLPFVVGIVVAALIGLIVLGYYAEKKRREELIRWARDNGYSFSKGKDYGIAKGYGHFDVLRQGDNRYAHNIVRGAYKDVPFCIFDFHYQTYSTDSKGRRQTHHHHLTALVCESGITFPSELRIRPEGLLDKLAGLIGFDDIDFESSEFSKAFHVKSKNRKFAYDIVHPRMMEFLLANRGQHIEFEGDGLCITRGESRLKAQEWQGQVDFASAFLALIPDYVVHDLSSRDKPPRK